MKICSQEKFTRIVSIATAIAFLVYAALFAISAHHPIIEAHGFRQTQTAISVFYMLEQGLSFNYITPVTGTPWTIPFEAPIYQLSVAAFSYISPFSLDMNGRIVSALYWLACLWGGFKIFRQVLPQNPLAASIFVLLALCSPLYIFWSRTFMIETTTLFFGLVFLYSVIRVTQNGRLLFVLLATFSGMLCILAKATTWPAFVAAGGIYFIASNRSLILEFRPKKISNIETQQFLLRGTLLLASVIAALIVGIIWTKHSDAVKLQTHFGTNFTSDSLIAWNFGTVSDRMGVKLWHDTILKRALPEAIGYFWFIPFIGGALLALSKRKKGPFSKEAAICIFCIILFLMPLLIFTNLHMVHNYYQMGASIFVIASAAALISSLLTASRIYRAAGLSILSLVVIGQILTFSAGYFNFMKSSEPFKNTARHQIALLAKTNVPEDMAIITMGLDWSSHFHYYAERKGVAVSLAWGEKKIQEMADNPELVVGDMSIGGIVKCKNQGDIKRYPESTMILERFIKTLLSENDTEWMTHQAKHCRLYYRTHLPIGS